MDEISVKGKKYLKAKLIARELGYTNDYIGQLCRSGKIDAELVGRTWYVDPDSVRGHKSTRYRSSKAATKRTMRSEVLERIREEESQIKHHFYSPHRPRAFAKQFKYETDETELVPVTNKERHKHHTVLPIELADARKVAVETETNKHYHFEAPEREETKFFGTLRVTDFLTEVSVEGLDEHAHSVPVKGKTHKALEPEPETKPFVIKGQKIEAVPETFKLRRPAPLRKPKPEFGAAVAGVPIPVTQEEEEVVRLPIVYKLLVVAAFIFALVIATASVGLQASISADNTSTEVEYAFTVENLSALIYNLRSNFK